MFFIFDGILLYYHTAIEMFLPTDRLKLKCSILYKTKELLTVTKMYITVIIIIIIISIVTVMVVVIIIIIIVTIRIIKVFFIICIVVIKNIILRFRTSHRE